MIQVKPLGYYALSLIGIATMVGHSHKTTSEYVTPSEAVPLGRAAGWTMLTFADVFGRRPKELLRNKHLITNDIT